ncbi:MAG: hemolysin family protein [Oscillospiraceae bacterium]
MLDDPGPMLFNILMLIILILINAYFAASEIAIITLNDAKLQALSEDGNKKAKTVCKLIKEPSKFLATIQIGVTLSGLLASAFTAESFAMPIATWLSPLIGNTPPETIKPFVLIVLTLILSFFTLVFGELVPKRLAIQNPEKMAFSFSKSLMFFFKIFKPFVYILAKTTNGIVRLCGVDPNADDNNVTEEEIRMMVDVGNEKGVIETSQREMINNIFEFDDRTADEIMTHRTEVEAVSIDSTISDVTAIAIEMGYSRIPVYDGDIDSIVGIIYVKDLLPLVCMKNPEEFKLKDFLRKAYFVPESNRCKELFKEFTDKKIQLAIVVDEYGGTAGIVTMEDVLEAIVGNIQDEYDDEEDEILKVDETTFNLEGSANLEDVFEKLEIELPENADYETIGGFIIDQLGRIPEDNETFEVEYAHVLFKIVEVEEKRISKIVAQIQPRQAQDLTTDN